MFAPQICSAKLIYPRDAKLMHSSGRCQSLALPGKQRCARHGGRNTGPRSPEGMEHVAERMRQGRLKWIARIKAEGRPLPFAGFRPKGSGKTREFRAEECAVRAKRRATYSVQKARCSEAVALSKAVCTTIGDVRPSALDHPTFAALSAQALKLDSQLRGIPADGPFAAKVVRAKSRSLKALLPVLKAVIEEAAEKEAEVRKRRESEEADRRREKLWAYWREIASHRQEAIERAQRVRESQLAQLQARLAPAGDPATGSLDA